MREQIVRAINERRIIELDYHPGLRRVEPHACGESASGNLLVRAFQVEGVSASGEHVNWKLFRVDRIAALAVTEDTFAGPRPEYKKGDSHMKGGILCEL